MPTKKKTPKKSYMTPCPFCKSPQWGILQTADEKVFNIMCLSCYASGPDASSPLDAKIRWNTRDTENAFAEFHP